jgi:hypothetical protein
MGTAPFGILARHLYLPECSGLLLVPLSHGIAVEYLVVSA